LQFSTKQKFLPAERHPMVKKIPAEPGLIVWHSLIVKLFHILEVMSTSRLISDR